MGAFFGSLTALSIGLSDLFGRRVVITSNPVTAAVIIQFVAMLASIATLGMVGSEYRAVDIGLGLLSGLGLGTGLVFYFGGLIRSTSTVVAPVVATLSALIPFVYTAVVGTTPTALALTGAALAIGGLALVTVGGRAADRVRTGLLWGLVAGLAYGIGLTVIIEASEASGSWPAVSQRIGALALMLVAASVLHVPTLPPLGLRWAATVSGVFAGLSTVFYLLGVQADAPVAVVTASMFPAVSVAVGWLFYRDSVTRVQVVGIVAVLAGVSGVVAG